MPKSISPLDIPQWNVDLNAIVQMVRDERLCQLMKWGPQDHDDGVWLKILVEEVGEVSKAMLEKDSAKVASEAIQVAAVAICIAQVILKKRPA